MPSPVKHWMPNIHGLSSQQCNVCGPSGHSQRLTYELEDAEDALSVQADQPVGEDGKEDGGDDAHGHHVEQQGGDVVRWCAVGARVALPACGWEGGVLAAAKLCAEQGTMSKGKVAIESARVAPAGKVDREDCQLLQACWGHGLLNGMSDNQVAVKHAGAAIAPDLCSLQVGWDEVNKLPCCCIILRETAVSNSRVA